MPNGILVPVVEEKRDEKGIFSVSRAHLPFNKEFTVKDVFYGEWKWEELNEDGSARPTRAQRTLLIKTSLVKSVARFERDNQGNVVKKDGKAVIVYSDEPVVWPVTNLYKSYRLVKGDNVVSEIPTQGISREVHDLVMKCSDTMTIPEAIEAFKKFFGKKKLIRLVTDTLFTVEERDWSATTATYRKVQRPMSYFDVVKA